MNRDVEAARQARIEALRRRIAECSPDQRRLLERMLRKEGIAVPGAAVGPEAADVRPAASTAPEGFDAEENSPEWRWAKRPTKEKTRDQYDSYHEACDRTVFGRHSFFMNLGYLENECPQYSPIALPPHVVNRNSVKLALEVIGECDVSGRDVLDVGCGRGGTIHVIQTYYQPASTHGVDLSPRAISFCRETHTYPNARFTVGDAETLPRENASVDVVTNIESSHSYPDRLAFYREVYRVLRPGGYFLYSDVLPVDFFRGALDDLMHLGFEVEHDRDITSNVLASCDHSATAQFQAFAEDSRDRIMANALGVPGSKVYEDMKNGVAAFRITRLRKT
jgi:SAM-dependent methyltransferase